MPGPTATIATGTGSARSILCRGSGRRDSGILGPEQTNPSAPTTTSEAVATTLFNEVFQDRDVTAFDRYVAGPCYQHNPQAPDGIEAPKQVLAAIVAGPHFNVSTKRVITDGDYVAIHSHYHFTNDRGIAIVDLFRVRDGKVVEHWDVRQPVPETSANNNTMF